MNTCQVPYRALTIDFDGNCFICHHSKWLPMPIGRIENISDLHSVWSSPIARMLQQDIELKRFTWCATKHCGILRNHQQLDHYQITVMLNGLAEDSELNCTIDRLNKLFYLLDQFTESCIIKIIGTRSTLDSAIVLLVNNYTPTNPGQILDIQLT